MTILLILLMLVTPHQQIKWDPVGDLFYMTCPQMVLQAIRYAEGVPSYGIASLAFRYGGQHRLVPEKVGRATAAKLLHRMHKQWNSSGRTVPFLLYLGARWAPIGAANDPKGLNKNWLPNVGWYIAKHPC